MTNEDCLVMEMRIFMRKSKYGKIVWYIEEDDDNEFSVGGSILVAENEECVITSPIPMGYGGTISQYLINETEKYTYCSVRVFERSRIYYSREEAELSASELMKQRS